MQTLRSEHFLRNEQVLSKSVKKKFSILFFFKFSRQWALCFGHFGILKILKFFFFFEIVFTPQKLYLDANLGAEI